MAVFVEWRELGLKVVPLVHVPETDHIPAKRGEIQIGPGMNEIPENEWAIALPHVQMELADGRLVVHDEIKAENITKLSEEKAISLIHPGKDKGATGWALYRWWKEDPRPAIRAEIIARLRELKLPEPDKTEIPALTDMPIPKDKAKAAGRTGSDVAPTPPRPAPVAAGA